MEWIIAGFIVLAGVVMLLAGAKGDAANLIPAVFGTSGGGGTVTSTGSTGESGGTSTDTAVSQSYAPARFGTGIQPAGPG